MELSIFRWKSLVLERLGIEGLKTFVRGLGDPPQAPDLMLGLSDGCHRFEVKDRIRKTRPELFEDGYWSRTVLTLCIGMNPQQLRYRQQIQHTFMTKGSVY